MKVLPKKVFMKISLHNYDVYRMVDAVTDMGDKENLKNRLLGLRNRALILNL